MFTLTNTPINDILLGSEENADFLPKNRVQSRLRKSNRFLLTAEMHPFLLEENMPSGYPKDGKLHKGWFKKGNIPWSKGTKGVVKSWNKGKKLPEFSGKNHPCWVEKIKVNCKYCNKEMFIYEHRIQENRGKFCSKNCFYQYYTGKSKPMSTETKEKIKHTFFKIGHLVSNEIREIVSQKNKGHPKPKNAYTFPIGKTHPNWKGGITPLYKIIRELKENEKWIQNVFKKDNYTCNKCKKRGGKLEAHHIKRFSILLKEFLQEYSQFSPIEDRETLVRLAMTYNPVWDVNNGITLCKECHRFKKKGEHNVRICKGK
jgi:hypothetical protein